MSLINMTYKHILKEFFTTLKPEYLCLVYSFFIQEWNLRNISHKPKFNTFNSFS